MTRRTAALAASLLLFASPVVLASAPAAAQTAPSSEATDAEAHALFEAGRVAYNDARYEDALGYYRRSYELSHRPQLLYNIGQCEDRLRHDAEAVAAFEQFVAALPDAPQITEVDARLEILRRTAHATEATTTTTTTTTEPTPTDTTGSEATDTETTDAAPTPAADAGPGPAPWIVLAGGGALAIVGAILLGVGYADIATVDGANGVPFASVRGAYDDAPVLTGVGFGALGLGVALAGVGLVWGLSSGGGSGSSEHARLRIGPASVAITGSF